MRINSKLNCCDMKKMIIGAFIGSILLFFLQFLSWSVINIHSSEMQYTENQEEILEVLSENLSEGQYFLPTVPAGTSYADAQTIMKQYEGKPWAMIQYRDSFDTDMTLNLIRGWLVDLLAVFLLVWLLLRFSDLNFGKTVLASWAVGFIGYLSVTYTNSIWFETSTIPALIDVVLQWGIVGAWLGWWLIRK